MVRAEGEGVEQLRLVEVVAGQGERRGGGELHGQVPVLGQVQRLVWGSASNMSIRVVWLGSKAVYPVLEIGQGVCVCVCGTVVPGGGSSSRRWRAWR